MLDIRYFDIPTRLQPYIERAMLMDFTHALGEQWESLPLGCHNVSLLTGTVENDFELEAPDQDGSFCGIAPAMQSAYCDFTCLGFSLGLTPLGVLHLPLHTHDFDASYTLPSEAVFGRPAWLALRRQVRDASTPELKMQAFMAWMEEHLMNSRHWHGRAAAMGDVALQLRTPTAPAIVEAATRVGVHRRQFERDFRRFFGTSPKHYVTVSRVQHVAQMSWQGIGLAGIAAELGFTDQAHMSHVVKKFTGMAPSALLRKARASRLANVTRPFSGGRITHI